MAEYVAVTPIVSGQTRYSPGDEVPEHVVEAGNLAALGAVTVDGLLQYQRCVTCGD
jgi:hypothetical protein